MLYVQHYKRANAPVLTRPPPLCLFRSVRCSPRSAGVNRRYRRDASACSRHLRRTDLDARYFGSVAFVGECFARAFSLSPLRAGSGSPSCLVCCLVRLLSRLLVRFLRLRNQCSVHVMTTQRMLSVALNFLRPLTLLPCNQCSSCFDRLLDACRTGWRWQLVRARENLKRERNLARRAHAT